jgi:preprotein translocase subunit SecG
MSGFMTGRSTANLLTRTTAILAGFFMLTSISLAFLAGNQHAPRSVVDQPAPTQPQSQPQAPAEPAAPSVPLAK